MPLLYTRNVMDNAGNNNSCFPKSQDLKPERDKRQGQSKAFSEHPTYLFPREEVVTGTCYKAPYLAPQRANELTQICHSVTDIHYANKSKETESVRRRATTLEIDMSSQRHEKSVIRKRLFGFFSKPSDNQRTKVIEKKTFETNRQEKSDPFPPVPTTHRTMTSSAPMLRTLLEILTKHEDDLRFAVSPLHDSIARHGETNCFQVSTYFPPPKNTLDTPSIPTDAHRDRLTPRRRQWAKVRSRSIHSMEVDDGDDDKDITSNACLRRPDPRRRRPMTELTSDDVMKIKSVHRVYSCRTGAERTYWLHKFQCTANPDSCSEKHCDNKLRLCIQEIKGVPAKNEYFCEIYLDDSLYAQTTVKKMGQILSWSEEFELSHLPKISEIRILLWMSMSDVATEKRGHRGASLPRISAVHCSDQSSVHKIPMSDHPDRASLLSTTSLETYITAQDLASGKRKREARKYRKKALADFCLLAMFTIPMCAITNGEEKEAWYSSTIEPPNKQSSFANGCLPTASLHSERLPPTQLLINSKRLSLNGIRLSRKTLAQLDRSPPRLRLRSCRSVVSVLPLCGYGDLLCSLSTPSTYTAFLRCLEPCLSVRSKAALAKSLLDIHQFRQQVPTFLSALVLSEVRQQDNLNMVLRSNSLATKAIELYLKQVGGPYLKAALGHFVATVYSQVSVQSSDCRKEKYDSMKTKKLPQYASEEITCSLQNDPDFEVDPNKVTNSGQLLRNQANLMRLVRDVWRQIQGHLEAFPNELRTTFGIIREEMISGKSTNQKIENEGLFEHVVSACVFLRFICPAILSPELFELISSPSEDPRAMRTFTLVAKTILNLANFTLFGDVKELHMEFLNRFVAEEIPNMRLLLWSLSKPSPAQPCGSEEESRVHTAELVDVFSVSRVSVSEKSENIVTSTISSVSASTSCNRCSSIILKSDSNLSKTSSQEQQTNAHLLLSDMAICHQAICGIPVELRTTRLALQPEQLQLAVCLANCHVQLQAAIESIPPDKLSQPLQLLRATLSSLRNLVDTDTESWHTKDPNLPTTHPVDLSKLQVSRRDTSTGVSALSLSKSTSQQKFISGLLECKEAIAGNGETSMDPNKSIPKTKSVQLISRRNVYRSRNMDTSKSLSNCLNTASEPGPLRSQDGNSSPPTENYSPMTPTVNASTWSLLRAVRRTALPSEQSLPNSQTFQSDSSSASVKMPSSVGSSSGGSGRPSNYPIMGTCCFTGGGYGIQRSSTYPVDVQEVCSESTSSLNPLYDQPYPAKRNLVSVQTQTSGEQFTEADEGHYNCANVKRKDHQRTRHSYVNILDEFTIQKRN